MNYTEAMAYIESLQCYGCVPGLANIEKLCKLVGDPEKGPCSHMYLRSCRRQDIKWGGISRLPYRITGSGFRSMEK